MMNDVINMWDHKGTKYLSRGSINAQKTIYYIHQKKHIIYEYLIFSMEFYSTGHYLAGSVLELGTEFYIAM